jgi:hypothetical protein
MEGFHMTINIKTARGYRHICSGCTVRFYDLGKSPACCPQCGHKVPIILASTTSGRRRTRKQPMESTANGHLQTPAPVVVEPQLAKRK